MYTYIYPITRYSELTSRVQRQIFTNKEHEIMQFYDTYISDSDMTLIINAYKQGNIQDNFDYIKNNIIERDPCKDKCKYYEIMGDLQFYEGLENLGFNTYDVQLGS